MYLGESMLDDVLGRLDFADAPSALIFADTLPGAEAAATAVMLSGGRVSGKLMLDEADDRLDRQAAVDVVLIELSDGLDTVAGRLLDRLVDMALSTGQAVVVTAPLAALDSVAARLGDAPVTLLCEPADEDRISALALAWATPAEARVSDISTEMDSIRLRRLAEEVSRIARTLSSLSSGAASAKERAKIVPSHLEAPQKGYSSEPAELAATALPDGADIRAMIRLRRLRDGFFETGLFADPAWDMLLDLLAARVEGEKVAVSSLCIAAAVPPTTALRWIKTMTDNGLLERHADPLDGRRIFIRLSDPAAQAMARYFAAAKRFEGVTI